MMLLLTGAWVAIMVTGILMIIIDLAQRKRTHIGMSGVIMVVAGIIIFAVFSLAVEAQIDYINDNFYLTPKPPN